MKALELKTAKGTLSEYASEASKEAVVLMRAGRPVAAIIPITSRDLESLAITSDPRFKAILRKSRADYKRHGGLTVAEMKAAVKKGAA